MLKRRGQSTAHKHTGDHIRSQDRAGVIDPVSCLCVSGAPGHMWLWFRRSGQVRCCVLFTSRGCSWTTRGGVQKPCHMLAHTSQTCWPNIRFRWVNPAPQVGTGPAQGQNPPLWLEPRGRGAPASGADHTELSLSACRTRRNRDHGTALGGSRPETPKDSRFSFISAKALDFLIHVSFEGFQVNLSSWWKSGFWVSISVLSPSGWRDGRY